MNPQTTPAMADENWKKELLALEQEYSTMAREDQLSIEERLVERKVEVAHERSSVPGSNRVWKPSKPAPLPPPRTLVISRSNAKFIESVARVLYQHKRQEDEARQATSISVVDQKPFVVKPQSLESYIVQALLVEDLDINALIDRIQAAGYVSESKHHRYSGVAKVLRRDYYMFAKSGGKYKLREAFRPKNNEPRPIPKELPVIDQKIPSVKDIIVDILQKKTGLNQAASYPAQIFSILQHMGYRDVSYKTVHRAMQDTKVFKRNGLWYSVLSNTAG